MTASLASAAAAATTLVVSHDGQHQWQSRVTDNTGAEDPTAGSVTFVTGPPVPPRGIGSLRLMTNLLRGDGSAQMRSTGYAGVLLTNLTELSYYAYSAVNNGQQFPYLAIDVSCGGCPGGTDRLFFEPPYQEPLTGNPACPAQGPTIMVTWQPWDALKGCWWDNNGELGSGGFLGVQPLSVFTDSHPDAAIRNPSGVGGVRLAVGFASDVDNFDGNIDMVTIGVQGQSTSYDFEPTPGGPTPGEGRVTGGGQIDGTRGRANFGFNVRETETGATGHINYRNHTSGAELNCPVKTLTITGNSATFGNTDPGCTFSVTVQDGGNPGKGNDTFSITSSSTTPPEFPSNNGTLTAGNIQVRSGP
jgi:hypothetical protein